MDDHIITVLGCRSGFGFRDVNKIIVLMLRRNFTVLQHSLPTGSPTGSACFG